MRSMRYIFFPLKEKPEDHRINLLKGIAIVGIVSTHFGGSFVAKDYVWSASFYTGLFLNQFFSFGVPVFVFLSGWLLEMRYGNGTINYTSFFVRRFSKIGIPYLVVSAVWLYVLRNTNEITLHNIVPKFFYYGTHPTLYFVPLIFQLYFFYPILRWLQKKLSKVMGNEGQGELRSMFFLLSVLLLLHFGIGLLASSGRLDYYTYCRPFSPFWAFYFIAGMFFYKFRDKVRRLFSGYTAMIVLVLILSLLFLWNLSRLLTVERVGLFFEKSSIDYAYSRIEIMPYNLVALFIVGFMLTAAWKIRAFFIEMFGRYSYYIYLWHLIALYYFGWQDPQVMDTCKKFPEAIFVFIFLTCIFITIFSEWYNMLRQKLEKRLVTAGRL